VVQSSGHDSRPSRSPVIGSDLTFDLPPGGETMGIRPAGLCGAFAGREVTKRVAKPDAVTIVAAAYLPTLSREARN